MHIRTFEKSFFRPVLASLALIIIFGCEKEPPQKPAIDLKKQGNALDIDAEKNFGEDSKLETQPNVFVKEPETGEYLLQISTGKIGLNSARASRITILEDIAQKIGFELNFTDESDRFVLLNQPMGGMAELLSALLEDVSYRAEYNAQSGDNGFRISRLSIDSAPRKDAANGAEIYSQPLVELTDIVPESSEVIFLGPDPDDEDLATRLQFGSIEDQSNAVSELTIDPAGLSAAYQVYTQTTSPEVRIAVLELIESEENYLAKLMIVLSLQSVDPAEVMVALSMVDSLDDFSLAPQVEALYNHPDAAVRELAKEVLESITSGYDEPDTVGAIPVIIDPRDSSRIEGGIAGNR